MFPWRMLGALASYYLPLCFGQQDLTPDICTGIQRKSSSQTGKKEETEQNKLAKKMKHAFTIQGL